MDIHFPEDCYEATVAFAALTREPAVQIRDMRIRIHQQAIEHYRILYADGKDLGPLAVVKEIDETGMPTGRLLLADGFLRAEALRQLGRVEAVCTIYTGDSFTANLIAARANGGRGLQFELYERKHTARRLLIDLAEQEAAWSIQAIADLTGLDRATVRELSQDLKHRRGLAIADAVDEHTCDGPASTDLADERPRYDQNVGYVSDPLFDNMPDADTFVSPPARRGQARAKSSVDKRRSRT
jgi:hypothetical protein